MTDETMPHRSAADITAWLKVHLAPLLRCAPDEIDERARFESLGLDSATAVRVSMDIEDWLGRPIDPTILYDYSTIEQLAGALAGTGPAVDTPDGRVATESDGSQ